MTLTIAVGSKNPVKVESVRRAFAAAFSEEIEVLAYDVPSGVSNQPWDDQETREGALNRAYAAAIAHRTARGASAAFSVGVEGGVEEDRVTQMHPSSPLAAALPVATVQCFAWLVVLRGATQDVGMARSATVMLPHRITALMRQDPPLELGDADDRVFSEINSKQKGGTVVKLTAGLINRTEYYEHAMKLALAPFLHDKTALYAVPTGPSVQSASPGRALWPLIGAKRMGSAFASCVVLCLVIAVSRSKVLG